MVAVLWIFFIRVNRTHQTDQSSQHRRQTIFEIKLHFVCYNFHFVLTKNTITTFYSSNFLLVLMLIQHSSHFMLQKGQITRNE